jgi:Tfp pilus assembly protein FimT
VMLYGFWQSERGFSILEVMITITVMMIVFLIASSTWFEAVESRRVDSATTQVVAELRLAHASSTNKLADWRVELDADGTTTYQVGPGGDPVAATVSSWSLPEGTQLSGGVSSVVFEANGEAQITGAGNITVAAADGDGTSHTIEVNPITSKIEVD